MLHLRDAGFEFEIATPMGKQVVFEMWAMPREDKVVLGIYEDPKASFENPTPQQKVVDGFLDTIESYAAVFVPGGHGAMLGIPEDPKVGVLLRLAHENELFTISLCHGPGSFLATTLEGHSFLYGGYKMAVFPDSVDKTTLVLFQGAALTDRSLLPSAATRDEKSRDKTGATGISTEKPSATM